MKNSQIAIGAILIALIAGGAYLLNKDGAPATESAATTEAPAAAAAAPEGVAPAAPECTQYTLKAGEWVCTSGN